jgi:hypothetical protein
MARRMNGKSFERRCLCGLDFILCVTLHSYPLYSNPCYRKFGGADAAFGMPGSLSVQTLVYLQSPSVQTLVLFTSLTPQFFLTTHLDTHTTSV